MGMVNQLGKFVPILLEETDPLRLFLSKKYAWEWGPAQHKAYTEVKLLLPTTPTLVLYDVNLPTKITADSPSYGLGGEIMQQHSEGWYTVAYASRTLTATEKQKEVYILGLNFTMETDHKPLVPLLGHHDIELLPPHLQRFRLCLVRY